MANYIIGSIIIGIFLYSALIYWAFISDSNIDRTMKYPEKEKK